jgi:hypothetical protein
MTKCSTCGLDYVEGRICAVQKKQDGNVLCVPERVVRKTSGEARVKRNLMCAKFTFPEWEWRADLRGDVFSGNPYHKYFDLAHEIDLKAARARLMQHGWEIKEATRDRKPYYRAVKHLHEPGKPKTGKGPENEDIEILIGRVVEKVLEGR